MKSKSIPPEWADRVIALARVYVYAVEVFEDKVEALRRLDDIQRISMSLLPESNWRSLHYE